MNTIFTSTKHSVHSDTRNYQHGKPGIDHYEAMIGSKRIEYEVEGDLVSVNEQFLNDTSQDLHLGQKTSQLCKGDAMGRL